MYEADEPNLPSVLDEANYANPPVERFQEYTQQRFELMTDGDCFVARCMVVDYIYRNLDEAQADFQKSKDEQEQKKTEEQGRADEERDQGRELYVSSSFNSATLHLNCLHRLARLASSILPILCNDSVLSHMLSRRRCSSPMS